MRKIIIGQILTWSNIVGVLIGYHLFNDYITGSEYLSNLVGFLGAAGASLNAFFAIALQISGWADLKIIIIKP